VGKGKYRRVFHQPVRSGTYLVVDDYFSIGNEKALPTKIALDRMEKNHEVECLGVYGWGTWVGIVR